MEHSSLDWCHLAGECSSCSGIGPEPVTERLWSVMTGRSSPVQYHTVGERQRAASSSCNTCSSCAAASRRTAPAVGESFGGHDTIAAHAADRECPSRWRYTVKNSKNAPPPPTELGIPFTTEYAPQTHSSGVLIHRQATAMAVVECMDRCDASDCFV